MLTVRIFSLTNGVYDLERRLVWSGYNGPTIVADNHCPLAYIFRTLESYGLTDWEPDTKIIRAVDPVQDFRTGKFTEYHASIDGVSDHTVKQIRTAYQTFLAR
jgi:hypothetical protein